MAKKVELAARWVGVAAVAGAASLALRLVYEQAWLTGHPGPHLTGPALFHSGLGFIGAVGVLVGVAWAIAVAAIAPVSRSHIPMIDAELKIMKLSSCPGL